MTIDRPKPDICIFAVLRKCNIVINQVNSYTYASVNKDSFDVVSCWLTRNVILKEMKQQIDYANN